MAVVDSLLALADSQGALGLRIASGEAPALVFHEETRSLSMPAVSPETVAGFVDEVASVHELAQLGQEGSTRCFYEAPSGHPFAVEIEGRGASLRLAFRLASADSAEDATAEAASRPAIGNGASAEAGPSPPAPASELPLEQAEPGLVEARIDALVRSAVSQSRAEASAPVGASANGRPVAADVRLLDLLECMDRERASDLILSAGAPPRLRTAGALRALDGPELDDAAILSLVEPAMDARATARLGAQGSVDLAIEFPLGVTMKRFRVNLFRQQRGLAAAIRPIRPRPPTLRDLNLPDTLHALAEYPNGLVLVTGPTGSGKSTTLVALVEHLNRSASRHIVTLEDPIEYTYTSKRSLVHQRERGRHVESFAEGLRSALREDPDVILVGEMRDAETISAALTAAETGHLVLSTLHSANPWMAVDRMIDAFPAERQAQARAQIAGVLRDVVSQHLVVSVTPPSRVPAYERLVVTKAAANQIRENKVHQLQSTIQTGRDEGMVSLEWSLAELVRSERLAPDVAQGLARDGRMLTELVAR